MPFTAFSRGWRDARIVQTRAPPGIPPDISSVFVANGYRTTYANFVKCPQ